MNVLFFICSASRCGPTNVVYGIIKYLKEYAPDVKIHLATIWDGDNPAFDFINKYADDYFTLNGIDLAFINKVNNYVANNKIDIIHSHGLIPDVYSGITNTKYNAYRISTLHCNLNEDYSNTYKWYKFYPYIFIHKLMLTRLNKVVGVSYNALNSIKNLNVNPLCIHNGVEETTSILKSSDDTINLLYFGVLSKLKNLDFLFENLKNISFCDRKINLIIYGKGELEAQLKEAASKLDNVTFKGFVTKPSAYYTSNSILVSASLSEGMPMSVIEALGAGMPALISNIVAHQEIKHEMQYGVELFDFDGNSFELALNGIIKILDDKDHRNKIIASFNNSFSYKCMGAKYLKLYNDTFK